MSPTETGKIPAMATNDKETEQAQSERRSSGITVVLIVMLLAGGAGAAAPFLLPRILPDSSTDPGSPPTVVGVAGEEMTFVPFGDVTVNLDEGRMNRYLRLKLSLQVRGQDRLLVEKVLPPNQLILRNWLLSHLSDKQLEQIRGKAGQNMLRREIRNHFNATLFPTGNDKIYDILFEEFNVQ